MSGFFGIPLILSLVEGSKNFDLEIVIESHDDLFYVLEFGPSVGMSSKLCTCFFHSATLSQNRITN